MPTPTISESMSYYLYEIKERIQEYGQDWDQYKKYTNPYEYIHSNLPNRRKSVSKYKPLSRSFFKMVELIDTFNLIPVLQKSIVDTIKTPIGVPILPPGIFPPHPPVPGIRTFHLAEGPGGFIEAVAKLRNCPIDLYVGMTIQSGSVNEDVPGWKKSARFLRETPQAPLKGIKTKNLPGSAMFVVERGPLVPMVSLTT
jgi:hypothetical protein